MHAEKGLALTYSLPAKAYDSEEEQEAIRSGMGGTECMRETADWGWVRWDNNIPRTKSCRPTEGEEGAAREQQKRENHGKSHF